ncbi:(S)-mandelate dehydrogenase [Paraburkholderia aspalathi]|uniref:alpha-hydroxy acid oxidase n=1 Tax=Paraburkholderia aspalathi TaxID=1324617 RepID=UPI00190B28CD|nr:alpha-hydroxy acid oxidase [Paraburkholderia aspalathi]MBK3842781.1 alpha-hydroxy-acid oxidizing protein [Paraburkholderia aspalathi]CAE6767214.1 (S)-mandelate dehydrogenase [Paraburkholderia aspalathi]CAE6837521.1 (S)-mandelate dehydrogenase [Paraburkholderia aspalathi]
MLSCVADYRIAAQKRLPRLAFDYLDGGAEDGDALRRNVEAYRQWLFKPRVLTDVSRCSSATQFLGREAAAPLIVGPTGLNGLFWPRADELLAHAASEAGLPFVLSTASTSLLEDVRAAAPRGDLWMQLYVQQDRSIAEDLMRRASAAGFSTLVLTVDVPVHGKRDHDTRNGFALPLRLSPQLIADCIRHPHWCWQMARHGSPQLKNIAESVGERADLARHAAMLSRQMDLTLGWADLEWVRRHWSGKLIVKGIQGRDDALLALARGTDGIVLSNHGGRQLDSTFAPLELLPEIADAVGHRLDVFVDGGVRRGSDALKAVSLGARGVLLGRAPLYGLASRGGAGVKEVLALMMQEMHIAMRLLGCSALTQLRPGLVERAA